jgi:histidine triad (HIT) family protein|tara:strand:- start:2480 stop:2896 length:417 start_codon:yes stop_codon:yes gene_type:complete
MSYNDKNIFAKILNGDAECVKVLENDFILAFMDVMPQAPGHTLVIPKYKTENLLNLDLNYFSPILEATQKIASSIKKVYSPTGVMVLQLNGAEAGQTVFHLHFHIIQRSEGLNYKFHSSEPRSFKELQKEADKIIANL